MLLKRQISIVFLFFLFFLQKSNAQIITSKKLAISKGIYQLPKVAAENVGKKVSDVTVFEKKIAAKSIDTVFVSKVIVETTKVPQETEKASAIANQKVVVAELLPAKKVLSYEFNDKEDKDLIFVNQNYLANQIVNNALPLVGTRYKSGGTTTSGMDCSGMVTAVFGNFDIKLPRSSVDMANVGLPRATNEAQKGDLIFFKTNNSAAINHVGLVVEVLDGEIKFIHASIQKGVIISSTNEAYYRKSFVKIKSVL